MPGLAFEKKINLGHILTMATVVVGMAMGWQAISGRVEALERSDARQDVRIEKSTEDIANLLAVINADRVDIRATLAELKVDVGYLRRWVEGVKRTEGGP